MAEFDDFNFDTSSDEGEFEGFTPDDVIKAIEKGAQLRQINDGELSDISFDKDDERFLHFIKSIFRYLI
jgi:hypothetical protein